MISEKPSDKLVLNKVLMIYLVLKKIRILKVDCKQEQRLI